MCVGVMATALASPLYPLYQSAWGLHASDITVIFVAYMIAALCSLLLLGRMSDRIGFLATLRGGLVVVTLGLVLSAVAWNAWVFTLSRIGIGIASGMITTSAAVGLTQLNRHPDPRRAVSMTTFAMTLGFGLGPLVGGLIAQWAPRPLASAYVPTIAMGVLAVYALYRVRIEPQPRAAASRAEARRTGPADWLPHVGLPPRAVRRPFWIGCGGAFSAFGVFSLYASLAPSLMLEIVPWHGPAVSGVALAAILFLSSAFQLGTRRLATKTCAVAGMAAMTVCNVLLLLTTWTGAAWLFIPTVLVTAFGHALANVTGMSVVNKIATPQTRAGLLSTYLVTGYVGSIVPILGVGWLSDRVGLQAAIMSYCVAMGVLTAVLSMMAKRTTPIAQPLPTAPT